MIREVLARIDPDDFENVVGPEDLADLLFKDHRVDIEDESTHNIYIKLRTSITSNNMQQVRTRTGLEAARAIRIRMRAEKKKKQSRVVG